MVLPLVSSVFTLLILGQAALPPGQPAPAPESAAPETPAPPVETPAPPVETPAPATDITAVDLEDLLEAKVASFDVLAVSQRKERLSEAPMSVYVVSREEMARWGVRGLSETLQRVPGYAFYNTDYYGQYGLLSRGLNSIWRFGYSLELMKVPDFGHTVFAPRFYKSVEVARGPGGLTWGSAAEAGLINLTLRDDLDGPEAHVGVGNFHRLAADLLYGAKFGNVAAGDGLFVGYHVERQDPEIQPNAFDIPGEVWRANGILPSYAFVARLQYRPVKLIVFREYADWVAPHIWFAPFAPLQRALEGPQVGQRWFHDVLETSAARAEYHFPLIHAGAAADINDLRFFVYSNLYVKKFSIPAVVVDTQRKLELGVNAQGKFLREALDVTLGGDLFGRDSLYDPSMTSAFARNGFGVDWYDNQLGPRTVTYHNLFAHAKYAVFDWLKLLVGTRYDWQESGLPRSVIRGAARAGVILIPDHTVTLKYIFNDTRRRPVFNEFAPHLNFETLTAHDLIGSLELGDTVQASGTVSYQSLDDTITRANNGAFNSFYNGGSLQNWALEWAIKYRALTSLLLYSNGSVNRAQALQRRGPDGSDLAIPHQADGRPHFVPALSTIVGAEYVIHDVASIHADVRIIADIPYRNAIGLPHQANAYFMDLTLTSRPFWDRVKVSLMALNLLNALPRLPAFGEHASNRDGTLAPEGRRIFGQVSISL